MKRILYAIQSTGNGHINRALSLIPILKEKADVDILISGKQGDIELPFEIKYRLEGLTYFFGKKGGIDYWKSITKMNPFRFLRDIIKLRIEEYDMVISDFEPVSAWAAKIKEVPCISISNQATILDKNVPRPATNDFIALAILKYYVPAQIKFGYNYIQFANNIFTPLIRNEIRQSKVSDQGYYTVYLPSFSDIKISGFLSQFENISWQVFSKNTKTEYTIGNINFFPVDKEKFSSSIVNCTGVFCNAGFETTSEALFLGKKLLVIPQKGQYEQACNVHILSQLGIYSILKLNSKYLQTMKSWLLLDQGVKLHFPDYNYEIADRLLNVDFNKSAIKPDRLSQQQMVLDY